MIIYQKNPGEAGRKTEIKDTLEEKQHLVGGRIEYTPFLPNIDICLNEEGKLRQLSPNIAILDEYEIIEVLVGPLFFSKFDDEGANCSLTDEDIEEIEKKLQKSPFIKFIGEDVTIWSYQFRSQ